MQISSYFRINAMETRQFKRTVIVADDRSFLMYLEGCIAPSYDRNQLHAAACSGGVVLCRGCGENKYSTVQNWDAGDEQGNGGMHNFVTKQGLHAGDRLKISWTQVETGSAITWKCPSVVLDDDDTVDKFYSKALANNRQQADTGTKMIHKGKNTSRIIQELTVTEDLSRTRSSQRRTISGILRGVIGCSSGTRPVLTPTLISNWLGLAQFILARGHYLTQTTLDSHRKESNHHITDIRSRIPLLGSNTRPAHRRRPAVLLPAEGN